MSQQHGLLALPPEVIMRVLDFLYINHEVSVECDVPGFQMKRVPMGAQLIRTCRQTHHEWHSLLYAGNIFNCSQRECLKLLLQSIGHKNFSSIKHIVIDWDQLQDFAWSLAKDDYNTAMSGLEAVDLANWHTQHTDGNSFVLRQSRSYERQLFQAAADICEKHKNLKVVVQRLHPKPARVGNTRRIKWRFTMAQSDARQDETVVPIIEELSELKASVDSEVGGAGAQQIIDPF